MHEGSRYFSLDEASRTLPLVRRIVQDIVDAYPAFQHQLQEFHEAAAAGLSPDSRRRIESLRSDIDASAERINGFISEIQQIGCMFKGFDEGLVDYYAMYRGRPILLCWKLGEDRIAFWHEVDAGFAGRQPISPEMIEELDGTRTAGR